ncbi:MAG: hypothetical protein HF312_17230 [Ignavibacteria bacterium]|jgi:hypothetical protein|nr:hypothetical protein [Ignavibacteria bacterium]
MPKIEIDMTNVGRASQKMWELVWNIEDVLGISYSGPDDFKRVSEWIDEHNEEYYHELGKGGVDDE